MPGRRSAGVTLLGLGLIAVGAWLVAGALGFELAPLGMIWPALPLLMGLALLLQAGGGRRLSGLVFFGSLLLLSGLLLAVFSLRVARLSWADFPAFAPLLLLILAAAFLAMFTAEDLAEGRLLVPVYVFGGLGWALLLYTQDRLRWEAAGEVLRYWPLLMVIGGLLLFLRQPPGEPAE